MTQQEHQVGVERVPRFEAAPRFWRPGLLFVPRRLPQTLLVLLVAAMMVGLGLWQLQRRAARLERNELVQQRMAQPPVEINATVSNPDELAYRPATVSGSFDYDNQLLLRNRTREGRPGFHLLTPLRVSDDTAVLIDRGWIPYEQGLSDEWRSYRGPAEAQQVRGLIRPSQTQPSNLAGSGRQDAWLAVDTQRMAQQLPYRLLPIYVEQSPEPGAPELPWRSNQVLLDQGRHLGYAIQWFSFAAILLIGYSVAVMRREQDAARPSPVRPAA